MVFTKKYLRSKKLSGDRGRTQTPQVVVVNTTIDHDSQEYAKMSEKKGLMQKIVTELVSEEAIPIVEYLRGKTRISEFIVAEELEMEIHKTRFLLYKLLEHNLVSFLRKKDKIKGWYICYWDLNEEMFGYLDRKLTEEKIEKLKERLGREEGNQFYLCRNACARMDFDKAMEFNFKCPECGEIMHHQDNSRTIEFLRERIKELQKDYAKIKDNIKSTAKSK